ncbi:large subunit ribosomal protein L21 [Micrococcales bacterium KH10]|nr:large subunit ribosomal protein L21 [Micrococcales bacterium KH10]
MDVASQAARATFNFFEGHARCAAVFRAHPRSHYERLGSKVVYAIVKAGGRQEKVSVGDIVVVDRLGSQPGDSVELPALLLVDGEAVTTDAAKLSKVKVTAEVVRDEKGPKIDILRYKNKTGYRRRQGHRSKLTRLKITSIA